MAWKVLSVDLPVLTRILVKYHFDDYGYHIQLTDLSRIWTESLSRDEIIEQALNAGSSIDPSEDDTQFRILLEKIESALNCEDGTSLSVASDEGEHGSSLRLDLSAPLPHPLSPFQWTLLLHRQAQECIETELVTPLILQSSNLERQLQQLIAELHDKDRVISKICDRLETSGNDLTTVFPGVSNVKTSRKKAQREQLAKHVKGLGDFDEAKFKQHDRNVSLNGEVTTSVIDEVFRSLPGGNVEMRAPSEWWKRLERGSQTKSRNQTEDVDINQFEHESRRSGRVANPRNCEESFTGDDFQKQGTPPHLKVGNNVGDSKQGRVALHDAIDNNVEPTSRPQDGEEESTTDEDDDLDAPSYKAQPAESPPITDQKQTSISPRKLGAIGGRSSQPAPEYAADNQVEVPKLGARMGAIGGRSKAPDHEIETTKGNDAPSMPYSPKKSTMGVIGGKKALTKDSSPSENAKFPEPAKEATPARTSPQAREKTPAPQEDPDERADKKRDQLKRELEEKAKAPVKKRRKF